jgi:hypothetical protein
MINRKTILTLLFAVAFLFSAGAQSVQMYLPDDALAVIGLDLKNLDDKVDFEQISKLDMINTGLEAAEMMSVMSGGPSPRDIMVNPDKYGLDLISKSYLTVKMNELGQPVMGFLMGLTDAAKFERFIKNIVKLPTEKKGSLQWVDMDEMGLAWNEDVLLFAYGSPGASAYQDFPAEEEQPKASGAMGKFMKSMLSNPQGKLIGNPSFQLHNTKSQDLSAWVDYSTFMELTQAQSMEQMAQGMGEGGDMFARLMVNMLKDLYSDSYWSMGVNMNSGSIDFNSGMQMSPELYEYTQNAMDTRINKHFGKYIKQDGLLGYYAFGLNVENTVTGMEDVLMPKLSAMPMVGGWAQSALDLLSIALDEEALYHLLEGDMMFAVTGLEEYTVTEIQYDEEFNPYEGTKSQVLPVFNAMLSFGDEGNIRKLLRLGENASVLSRQNDNVFKIAIPGEEMPMDIYLAITRDILMITSDADLVNNHLEKGYSGSTRLGKDHRKKLKKNLQAMHMDFDKIMDAVMELSPEMQDNPEAASFVKGFQNTFQSLELSAPRAIGNPYTANLSLTFDDKNRNSLEQLLNYFNEIFLASGMNLSM